MIQLKIILFSLLGMVALWFRGSAAKSKLETKVNELKVVKKNRGIMINAQEAMYSADIRTKQEVKDEIARIKAGVYDHDTPGW